MERRVPSRLALIMAILTKDALQYGRNAIYLVMSLAGLAMFTAVYWLMPAEVEEELAVGLSAGGASLVAGALSDASREGLRLVEFPDEDSLRRVMAKNDEAWLAPGGTLVTLPAGRRGERPKGGTRLRPAIGLAFPGDFLSPGLESRPSVRLLTNKDTPRELEAVLGALVSELAHALRGQALPVTFPEERDIVLGTDRTGALVPLRDRMRPLLTFFVLMIESFALSSLVALEVSRRTIVAIGATPARLSDVVAAKAIFGASLAFGQAALVLALTGGLASGGAAPALAAALSGAFMFSGLALLVGALGRDFMGNLIGTMLCVLPLAVPAVAAMLPGSTPVWVRLIPSWGVIKALDLATNQGAAWSELWRPLGASLLWVAPLLGLGLATLSRKAARL